MDKNVSELIKMLYPGYNSPLERGVLHAPIPQTPAVPGIWNFVKKATTPAPDTTDGPDIPKDENAFG